MVRCPNCGAMLDDAAKFCTCCGTAISSPVLVGTASPQASAQASAYQPNAQFNNAQNPYYGYSNSSGHETGNPPPPPPYSAAAAPVSHPTIGEIYSKSFAMIGQKPFMLWGLSLLYVLLCSLSVVFGLLPIIWIPVVLVLNIGMVSIFLDGYRGNKICAQQLFVGFKNFLHFCGGMAWMLLWIFLWGLIPIAGIVFAVIKLYNYRFVPYILLSEPEISASDALKKSVEQTSGYCGRMFGADIIIVACVFGAYILLYLLSFIPYMGIIFVIITFILMLAFSILAPLLFGVIQAAFYDEISRQGADRTDSSAAVEE